MMVLQLIENMENHKIPALGANMEAKTGNFRRNELNLHFT
jgi:hypothetical protein